MVCAWMIMRGCQMMFTGTEKGRYTEGVIKVAGLLLCYGSDVGWVTNREWEKLPCRAPSDESEDFRANRWFDSGPRVLVCRPKWRLRLPPAVGLREHRQEHTGSSSQPPPALALALWAFAFIAASATFFDSTAPPLPSPRLCSDPAVIALLILPLRSLPHHVPKQPRPRQGSAVLWSSRQRITEMKQSERKGSSFPFHMT